LKHIVRLSGLGIMVYVGIYFISKDDVQRDFATGGLTAWPTFVFGMLLLILAAVYAINLIDLYNRPRPDLGQGTRVDRALSWISDTEIANRRKRANKRRLRHERQDKARMRAARQGNTIDGGFLFR
jgi:hypothetical protein